MDKSSAFQSFEDISDSKLCAARLAALRGELRRRGLDGFVVPHADEYQSEYLPPRGERLAWLTAFTGSAGAAVVLLDRAAVFVDGRYTLQVRAQTDLALFTPHDLISEGPAHWIAEHLPRGAKLGFDPWLHSSAGLQGLKQAAEKAGGHMVAVEHNPIDAVWVDQPAAPLTLAVPQALSLAGEESASKRKRVGEAIRRQGAAAVALTLSDSICWLFNIRGADTPHTPFVLSYALLLADGTAQLFLDRGKISPGLRDHLGPDVAVHEPGAFAAALQNFKGQTVFIDPTSAPVAIADLLSAGGAVVKQATDPVQLPKACKNPIEVEGMRQAHLRDGAALSRFLAWLSLAAASGTLSEIAAAEALEGFRAETGALRDLSFDSISAAGPHAAIPHYRVTRSSNRLLTLGEIYLIDSGGQYLDGTTDVTRTIMIGEASAEMRDRFTRVLKGHIALATVRFPEGTTGSALDGFARRPLWEMGLDYDHGTGHGVGSFLSVHEGPQNISKRPVGQALRPGMICSNEPGYYKAGAFGIRIENLIVVRAAQPVDGGERLMMEFETITFAPIDLELVEPSLLNAAERDWLNTYHRTVREKISPLVDETTRNWLLQATREI